MGEVKGLRTHQNLNYGALPTCRLVPTSESARKEKDRHV
jgi:hypothetical protein